MKLELEIKVESEKPFNGVSIVPGALHLEICKVDEALLGSFISSFVRVLADQLNEHRRPGESMSSVLDRLQRSDF